MATALNLELSMFRQTMGFMEDNFDGEDMASLADLAAKWAAENKMVAGPLWDEIGPQILHYFFRKRVGTQRRRTLSPVIETSGNETARANYSYIPGLNRWCNIFDLTKDDVKMVADYYGELADANAHECRFWETVHKRLKKSQKVGDVFDLDGLKELRKKI